MNSTHCFYLKLFPFVIRYNDLSFFDFPYNALINPCYIEMSSIPLCQWLKLFSHQWASHHSLYLPLLRIRTNNFDINCYKIPSQIFYHYYYYYYYLREFQPMTSTSDNVLYHQTKTSISFWCWQILNHSSLIQPLKTSLIELTETNIKKLL